MVSDFLLIRILLEAGDNLSSHTYQSLLRQQFQADFVNCLHKCIARDRPRKDYPVGETDGKGRLLFADETTGASS